VTQERMFGGPGYGGVAAFLNNPQDFVGMDVPGLGPGPGGFERALEAGLVDRVRLGEEEAVRIRSLPLIPFADVGRYPVVFDGYAFGELVGQTVSFALDADRAVGIEGDAGGGTYLAPPLDVLNRDDTVFSPLLTMRADRALPSPVAAQWDDDGVVPEPFALVEGGRVVGYHTTRETAPYFAEWNAKHGRPAYSHGGSVAESPNVLPAGGAAHVVVGHSTSAATIYDLARDIEHGFIVRRVYVDPDMMLSTAMVMAPRCIEVKRGVPVSRTELNLQYVTRTFFKKHLVALGGESTVRTGVISANKGFPWRAIQQDLTAPAVLCKDVDVIRPLIAS